MKIDDAPTEANCGDEFESKILADCAQRADQNFLILDALEEQDVREK